MAKKKFYAVREGKIPGIYSTWSECEEQVKGFPGAKYQSFVSLEEAERYMLGNVAEESSANTKENNEISTEEFNTMVDEKIVSLKEDEAIAFVDGSYDATAEKSAFGAIIISFGGNKDTLYKAFTKKLGEKFISLRNVAAELEGVKEVISWAITYKKRKVTVFYDYIGIEKWATGQWKAKNEVTKKYVSFIQEKKHYIEVEFMKVLAHSGVKLNEEVDTLAKNALLAKGYKTYNDGSVYFVGYGLEDWKAIVDCINEENEDLLKENIVKISLSVEKIGTRNKITILQSENKVVINCYSNSKSYVQGKQTVLFQKVIATAIGLLKTGQSVIETLNSYHALTIKKEEVENKFEQVLPHYRRENEKHYANLLSSVYNTMLTGYMPDYTCLVTPIFRAYEFYLHRILGDIMGLDTETDKGTNNFSYFSKNSTGLYECNSKSMGKLTTEQLNFLNKLYTQYNSVRHPYSHWSANDIDTAVITDIAIARQIIMDGFELIDQYYTLF
ncbi:Ribonuclease HI-related protein [Clostridiaceae bacterium BL-3]|jgi:ribonuclease HI|nr:Ribonuclease HI-related protein [Clostridiaceae bacterium BL-3]